MTPQKARKGPAMKAMNTIEACDKPCAVCGRTHRKLKLHMGAFMGDRCRDNVDHAYKTLQSFMACGRDFATFVGHIGNEMGAVTAARVLTFMNKHA